MDESKLEKQATKWAFDTNRPLDDSLAAWYACYSFVLSVLENSTIDAGEKELYLRLIKTLVQ